MKISLDRPELGLRDVPFSFLEFDDLRSRANVFDEASVVWASSANLTGGMRAHIQRQDCPSIFVVA